MAHASAGSRLAIAAMFSVVIFSASISAQERTQPVVPERPARVQIIAGFDERCQSLAAPIITITKAPEKGSVSFRDGQETRVAGSMNGTCAGAHVRGTGIYYTANAGATGSDTFSITARLASGETSARTFTVRIAE